MCFIRFALSPSWPLLIWSQDSKSFKKKISAFSPAKKKHQRALSFDTPHIFKAHRE